MLTTLSTLIPISMFIGFAASAIGFTAWPLVVPVLYVIFGFDLYLTLVFSLLIDCVNSLVITIAAAKNGHLDKKKAAAFTLIAAPFVIAGLYIGTSFIPQNRDFFRGTAGYAIIILGIFFILRGKKFRQISGTVSAEQLIKLPGWIIRNMPYPAYLGAALMGLHTGMFGIGGGMGYALNFILFFSFSTLNATGNAMFVTFCTTVIASIGMYAQIPCDVAIGQQTVCLIFASVLASACGAAAGTRYSYSLPEYRVNYLVGAVIILAGLLACVQRYFFI